MEQSSPVQVKELRLLLKHLVVFLLAGLILRTVNGFILPQVSWSGAFFFLWSLLIATHTLILFMSQGLFGDHWEHRSSYDIADELLGEGRLRFNRLVNRFKKNQVETKQPTSN